MRWLIGLVLILTKNWAAQKGYEMAEAYSEADNAFKVTR